MIIEVSNGPKGTEKAQKSCAVSCDAGIACGPVIENPDPISRHESVSR